MNIKNLVRKTFVYALYEKIKFNVYMNLIFNHEFYKMFRSYKNVFSRFFEEQPIELKIKKSDKCLLLAPHPDDESIGCGGLLLNYPDQFNIICLTDGRFGGLNLALEQQLSLITERQSEFKDVMEMAKISSYNFLEIEDKNLLKDYDNFKNLDISNYDYIFIPNFLDINDDHKAVTSHLQRLLKEKQYKKNLKIAFYEVWSTLALPNYYHDISERVEEKKDLISRYKSQLKLMDYIDIINLNKYRGFIVNKAFAEAYTIIDTKIFLNL